MAEVIGISYIIFKSKSGRESREFNNHQGSGKIWQVHGAVTPGAPSVGPSFCTVATAATRCDQDLVLASGSWCE